MPPDLDQSIRRGDELRQYLLFAYEIGMGDIKLTPRETSRVLARLDEGVEKVAEARDEIIHAMARRRTKRTAPPSPRQQEPRHKKRERRRA